MNREDFHILNDKVFNRPLIYLDNAATTQKPHCVVEALAYAYEHQNANIHRGVHHLSQVATQAHEDARQAVATFLHARSAKEILFTKGTTDSLNTLAFSFGERFIQPGDEIIVSTLEHHSNIVPWQMLCQRKQATLRIIPLRDDLSIDIEAFQALLSSKTRLVSIAHVSNVLGIINPIEEIIRLAHQAGAYVSIDAAQSAPHLPIDVQALDCDFLSLSAHKMYAPTGVGVLYGKEEILEQLPPYQGGGEMIDHVRWSGTTYNQLPYKFEAGTPDFIGTYAFGRAIQYIQEIGMHTIAEHEAHITHYAEDLLSQVPGVRIYAKGLQKAGAISFNCYNGDQLIHPYDIGMLLNQQGIAVRTGHHCAEPLIDHLGIPGTVRASFALYTDPSDIDAFIKALKVAIAMLS